MARVSRKEVTTLNPEVTTYYYVASAADLNFSLRTKKNPVAGKIPLNVYIYAFTRLSRGVVLEKNVAVGERVFEKPSAYGVGIIIFRDRIYMQ